MTEREQKSDAIRGMYEKYPYPSDRVEDELILDLANGVSLNFPGDDFSGKTIIDFGCGTAHRLVAIAKRYPLSKVIGVDNVGRTLEIARSVSKKNGVENIHFIESDILSFRSSTQADLIVSTGVLHHLADPLDGLRSIASNLKADGVAMIWLYHAIGEFLRLRNRELARLLVNPEENGYEEGIQVLKELHFPEVVDSYLHPEVHAFEFNEAHKLCSQAGFDWFSVSSVNRVGESKLVDFSSAAESAPFSISGKDLFQSEDLVKRFEKLSVPKKMRALELAWQPNGFSFLTGKKESYRQCDARVLSTLIQQTNGDWG